MPCPRRKLPFISRPATSGRFRELESLSAGVSRPGVESRARHRCGSRRQAEISDRYTTIIPRSALSYAEIRALHHREVAHIDAVSIVTAGYERRKDIGNFRR